jgi:sigma-B regulation protein RsbU (phosphoserine phosphatase)
LQLEAGARLYLYSDGVTDCLNRDEETFGQQRLERLLEDSRERPIAEVGKQLHAHLCNWQGGMDSFGDDVTFLAMEFKP